MSLSSCLDRHSMSIVWFVIIISICPISYGAFVAIPGPSIFGLRPHNAIHSATASLRFAKSAFAHRFALQMSDKVILHGHLSFDLMPQHIMESRTMFPRRIAYWVGFFWKIQLPAHDVGFSKWPSDQCARHQHSRAVVENDRNHNIWCLTSFRVADNYLQIELKGYSSD
jgi:hypothetical protein